MNTVAQPESPVRNALTDAIRYWEPRRLWYNLALAAVVVRWVVFTWPHFRSAIRFEGALQLLFLAVLANLCYTTAYVPDLMMNLSDARESWRRRRWMLFAFGTVFAVLLAWYWIGDEIYPFVTP